jgi:hypothetical protein
MRFIYLGVLCRELGTVAAEAQGARRGPKEIFRPAQAFKTKSVPETIAEKPTPGQCACTWGVYAFNLNVLTSSTRLKFTIYDNSTAAKLGQATLTLGSDGIPGPQIGGPGLSGYQVLRQEMIDIDVQLLNDDYSGNLHGAKPGALKLRLGYRCAQILSL